MSNNQQTNLQDLLAQQKAVPLEEAFSIHAQNNELSDKRMAPAAQLPHPEVGVSHTPLTRAVMHLLKIGSTHKSELEQMAEEFITTEGACKKLRIDFDEYLVANFIETMETIDFDIDQILVSAQFINAVLYVQNTTDMAERPLQHGECFVFNLGDFGCKVDVDLKMQNHYAIKGFPTDDNMLNAITLPM